MKDLIRVSIIIDEPIMKIIGERPLSDNSDRPIYRLMSTLVYFEYYLD